MSSPSKDEKKANNDSKEAQSNDKKTTYVDLKSQPGKKEVASKLFTSEKNESRKGILKTNQTQTPLTLPPPQRDEKVKFDEENIKETFHPADKDYGKDKIDEPPTINEPLKNDEEFETYDPEHPQQQQAMENIFGPEEQLGKPLLPPSILTQKEIQADREKFEQKHRSHYDEAYKIAEARKLIAADKAKLENEEAEKQSKVSQAEALVNRHKAAVAAEKHEQEKKNLMKRGGKEKWRKRMKKENE